MLKYRKFKFKKLGGKGGEQDGVEEGDWLLVCFLLGCFAFHWVGFFT